MTNADELWYLMDRIDPFDRSKLLGDANIR